MAHSSLLGIDRVPTGAPGHDTASLGPSDTSDSGSDRAGLEEFDDGDATLPVDIAIAADRPHPDTAVDVLGGDSDSDSGGTGERRSVGGDGGGADGADISPDRIVAHPDASDATEDFEPLAGDGMDDSDALLAAVAEDDGAEAESEDEDGNAVVEADPAIRPRTRRMPAG